ncbi:DNA-binding transcriptional MerR regulator [Paenibacillus phyllosphaerae]|uniref:DNA-binding transcriptional MerR regulator n=1 Tax=Paenibacillus phyllosphaerae TaxID=274593 RepID=A0A7W5AUI3_9BACL|nr:MerR family transcriptional regulator [Paenibacillus phyllosphaerae]MBB3108789.1 DNA-binding transcriptional MerR regulator [Paenibacillus phyllosphaerae]
MDYRPKKLAAKFNLSPNTLRNYEAKGFIPPAERSANGYRLYTEQHEAYLACLQAMAPTFGMDMTAEVLHKLQRNELDQALWLVREREVLLHKDIASLEQLVLDLKSYAETNPSCDFDQRFSIHEVSNRTGAPKSAIRYWETCGLLTSERNPDNDYRLYHEAHLLKIRMILVLQNAVYSEETVNLKQSIAQLEIRNLEHAMRLADRIRSYLRQTIQHQMRGIYFLYRLIQKLGLAETEQPR